MSIDHEDLGEHAPERRKKEDRSQPLIKRQCPRSQDQWLGLIAGIENAQNLKILEWVAIETTIFPKRHVAIGSELRGEKWCGLKPLLATLQMCLREVMDQGNI